MRNIRFYETDAAFKAYEQGAGGDGNSTKTSIPGVSGAWDLGKTYFNPHDETKLTHTVTVKYVSMYDGTELADSETIEIKYLSGVSQELILYPKVIDGYVAKEEKIIANIPEDTSIVFYYKVKLDYKKPLTFNIISAGTIYWKAQSTAYTTTIEYSTDSGKTWTSVASNTGTSAPSISVNAGDVVQFRGDNATYATDTSYYNFFNGSTAKFEAEGNIMSLIDSTNFARETTLASSYTFYNLFYNCTGLTSAERLVLPATTLTSSCYNGMFSYCRSLTTAPELPATTLATNCYIGMFSRCTSLTTAPELPATTLARYCYYYMFNDCTSLTTAPKLPATTLAWDCYRGMFYNCTSLTRAPELPATTLADDCYQTMFYGCTSLNYIKCLATNISASYCTTNWVNGVASTGTFVKAASMSSWTTGGNGIPANWTVQDA